MKACDLVVPMPETIWHDKYFEGMFPALIVEEIFIDWLQTRPRDDKNAFLVLCADGRTRVISRYALMPWEPQ